MSAAMQTRNQYASTVARELGVSLGRLGELLGIETIKGRTPISAELKEQAREALEKTDLPKPQPAEPAASAGSTKPLREAVALLVERNIAVSVEQAAEFLGVSMDVEITVKQFKLLGEEFRTKPAEDAQLEVLARRPGRFGKVAKRVRDTRPQPTAEDRRIAEAFFVKVKSVWAAMEQEPQKVRVERAGYLGHRDALVPNRIIELPLKLYRELETAGELPLLHDDTVTELANELAGLSLFHTHGTYCGLPLDVYYEGIVRSILGRQTMPPLVKLRAREMKELGLSEARPFIFHDEHRACQMKHGLIDMMSNVEPEFSGPETPAKDALRVARYMEELRKVIDQTGKTRLQKILESETVFDRTAGKRRHLTSRELFTRMKAINENLNKEAVA